MFKLVTAFVQLLWNFDEAPRPAEARDKHHPIAQTPKDSNARISVAAYTPVSRSASSTKDGLALSELSQSYQRALCLHAIWTSHTLEQVYEETLTLQASNAPGIAASESSSSLSRSSPSTCLLTSLPPELRNNIYELIFSVAGKEERHLFKAKPPPKALLSTSRHINKETAAMYRAAYRNCWSCSRFTVMDPAQMTCSYNELANQFEGRDIKHIKSLRLLRKDRSQMVLQEGLWREAVVDALSGVSVPKRYLIMPAKDATTYLA